MALATPVYIPEHRQIQRKQHCERFAQINDNRWVNVGSCDEIGVYRKFDGKFYVYFDTREHIYYSSQEFDTLEAARRYVEEKIIGNRL